MTFYSKVKSKMYRIKKSYSYLMFLQSYLVSGAVAAPYIVMSDTIQIIQAKAVTLMGAAMAVQLWSALHGSVQIKSSAMTAAAAGFVTALVFWYGLGHELVLWQALPACLVCFIVIMVGSVASSGRIANESADKETMDPLIWRQNKK